MFTSGRFRLAARLGSRRLDGVVRWPGGATLRLPLLDARAAFSAMATQRPCGLPYPCGQLTVTGVRPAMVTAATSRGLAHIPAWQFTVAGLSWPVSQIAVAPSAMAVLPTGATLPSGTLAGVSAAGRTLALLLPVGECGTAAYGADVDQSAPLQTAPAVPPPG